MAKKGSLVVSRLFHLGGGGYSAESAEKDKLPDR